MPIPNTGPISFSSIQTEFGGSNPISISEYYRGGPYVPNTVQNVAVPVSGTYAISSLRSASAYVPDYDPDAFNINNLIVSDPYPGSGNASGVTNTITITGISEPITLLFSTTTGEINHSSGSFDSANFTISIVVNGAVANSMSWSRTGQGGPGQDVGISANASVTVSNGATIAIGGDLSIASLNASEAGASANVIITNISSSNTQLDTSSLVFSASSIGGV